MISIFLSLTVGYSEAENPKVVYIVTLIVATVLLKGFPVAAPAVPPTGSSALPGSSGRRRQCE